MGRRREVRSTTVSPDHRHVHECRHRVPPAEIHLMEDRVAAQSHEIQAIFRDNQRLAAGHVELQQDLDSSQQEIGRLSASASSVKAERYARVCEIQEGTFKLEGEARSIERLKEELDRLRSEANGMRAEREELLGRNKAIDRELASARTESQQLSDIRAEIEFMRKETQSGRSSIEYEKEIHSYNLKLSDAMEQHLISMRNEEEQLHSQLANAEKRAAVAATAAYSSLTAPFPVPAAAFPAPFSAPEGLFPAPGAPFPAQYPWPGYAANPMNVDGGYSFYDHYAFPQSNFNAYPNYGLEAGLHWPSQAPYYFQ